MESFGVSDSFSLSLFFVYNLSSVIYDVVRQAIEDAAAGRRSKPKTEDNLVWAGVSLLFMLLTAVAG